VVVSAAVAVSAALSRVFVAIANGGSWPRWVLQSLQPLTHQQREATTDRTIMDQLRQLSGVLAAGLEMDMAWFHAGSRAPTAVKDQSTRSPAGIEEMDPHHRFGRC
jgi:hypothetical protein